MPIGLWAPNLFHNRSFAKSTFVFGLFLKWPIFHITRFENRVHTIRSRAFFMNLSTSEAAI
jgi:hypothetical protein